MLEALRFVDQRVSTTTVEMTDVIGAEPPVPLIELRAVSRTYETASGPRVEALRDVSIKIRAGEFVAIVGQSGSGKTTLLNLVGCLDQPTCGEYLLDGHSVGGLDPDELSRLRGEVFGFVFQQYNLIASATAQENVELPGLYSGVRAPERIRCASAYLIARIGGLRNFPAASSSAPRLREPW